MEWGLTVVVQGVLKVVVVQELVSSLAYQVYGVLEQGQQRLEWTQDVCSHCCSLCVVE